MTMVTSTLLCDCPVTIMQWSWGQMQSPSLGKTTPHAQCIHTKGDGRIERPNILIALMLKIQIVWDVAPCWTVEKQLSEAEEEGNIIFLNAINYFQLMSHNISVNFNLQQDIITNLITNIQILQHTIFHSFTVTIQCQYTCTHRIHTC